MSRYIDAAKPSMYFTTLAEQARKEGLYNQAHLYERCAKLIEDTPTADVVEVRHGEWIKQKPNTEAMKIIHDKGLGTGMGTNSIYWTCSICGNWGTPPHKYCCSCGAKMDGQRSKE